MTLTYEWNEAGDVVVTLTGVKSVDARLNAAIAEALATWGAGRKGAAAPDADGWIEWKGGECPVAPELSVWARLRDRYENRCGRTAGSFIWEHRGAPDDIVAYRVVTP